MQFSFNFLYIFFFATVNCKIHAGGFNKKFYWHFLLSFIKYLFNHFINLLIKA